MSNDFNETRNESKFNTSGHLKFFEICNFY